MRTMVIGFLLIYPVLVQAGATTKLLRQFPNEGWDGKTINYSVRVQFPPVSGKTLDEADALRKHFVLQGVRSALKLLFRIASFNASEFNVMFNGRCKGAGAFPPSQWNMPELVSTKVKEDCARGQEDTKGNFWIAPERDISSKSFQTLLRFGRVISQDGFETGIKNVREFHFPRGPAPETESFEYEKGTDGKEVGVLTAIPSSVIDDPQTEDWIHFDAGANAEFTGQVAVTEDFSIMYTIPRVALGGSKETQLILVPNQKLVEFFDSYGPNVSRELMNNARTKIDRTINPYGLKLGPVEGGLAGLVGDESVHGPKEKRMEEALRCVKSVELAQCKRIWAYLIVAAAQVEAQRDKSDPNVVTLKVSVPMDELRKVQEPYAKYIAH